MIKKQFLRSKCLVQGQNGPTKKVLNLQKTLTSGGKTKVLLLGCDSNNNNKVQQYSRIVSAHCESLIMGY